MVGELDGVQRMELEQRLLGALRELWSTADGALTTGALLAHLAERGGAPAPPVSPARESPAARLAAPVPRRPGARGARGARGAVHHLAQPGAARLTARSAEGISMAHARHAEPLRTARRVSPPGDGQSEPSPVPFALPVAPRASQRCCPRRSSCGTPAT